MLQLPDELRLEVIRFLDRPELKCLRLVNRTLSSAATGPLFRRMIMRPDHVSAGKAMSIAGSPALAGLVKELELLAETLFENVDYICEYMKINGSRLARVMPSFAIVDHAKFSEGRKEVSSWEGPLAARMEGQFLQRLVKNLPFLQSIDRRFYPASKELPVMPSTWAQQCGLQMSVHSRYFTLNSIIAALAVRPVPILRLRPAAIYDHLSHRSLDLVGLRQIQVLDLDLKLPYDEALGYLPANGTNKALRHFLANLHAVEDLRLRVHMGGDRLYCEQQFQEIHHNLHFARVWSAVLEQRWAHLKVLELRDIACTEHELLHFIARHANLKQLKLVDVYLHNISEAQQCSLGSILRTLWILPKIRQLDDFTSSGHLCACDAEHWVSDSRADLEPRSRRKRMHDYVCGRGDFPFPQLAEHARCQEVLAAMKPLFDYYDRRVELDDFYVREIATDTEAAANVERTRALDEPMNVVAALLEDQKNGSDVDVSWDWREPNERCYQPRAGGG